MPTVYHLTGTATATLPAGFSGVSGTAVADYSAQPTQVTGTTTVDDSGVLGWLSRADSPSRWNCVRVFLGPDLVEVTGLIGDVVITRDANAIIPTATFSLKDPRVTFFHPDSFAGGAVPVVVKAYSANIAGGSWSTRFRGTTVPGPDADPYVPRAEFGAVGLTAWMGTRNANAGCVRAPAFSEHSLTYYLAAYLTAAGATVLPSIPTTKTFLHPVDLSGVSPLELARTIAEVSGYYLRDLDGVLDWVWEPAITGGASKLSLSAANVFGISVVPPAEPTTALTLSCMRIMTERLWDPAYAVTEDVSEDTDSAGVHWQTITQTYTQGGVQVRQVVTEWKDYAPLGVDVHIAAFQIVKRTTSANTWVAGGPISYQGPTGQAASVTVTIETMSSPSTAPSSGWQWTDLSWHTDVQERLQVSSVTTTVSTWDDFCKMVQRVATTEGYFAPTSSTGLVWADGKTRNAMISVEPFQVTKIETEGWADNAGAAEPYRSVATKNLQAWSVTSYETIGDVAFPIETFGIVGTASAIATTTSAGRYSLHEDASGTYGDFSKTTPMEGQTPGPETRSPEIPQYQEEGIKLEIEAQTARYLEIRLTDSNPLWETMADLRRVGRRRLRDVLSPRVVMRLRAMPVLETLDCVDMTFPERYLGETPGYIEKSVETWSVLNGAGRMELTVAIPPAELTPTTAELVET